MISLHASNNQPLLLMKILHHCSKYSVHVKTCVDWYDNRSVKCVLICIPEPNASHIHSSSILSVSTPVLQHFCEWLQCWLGCTLFAIFCNSLNLKEND